VFCFEFYFEIHGGGIAGVGQAEGYDITEDGNSAQQNWSCKN